MNRTAAYLIVLAALAGLMFVTATSTLAWMERRQQAACTSWGHTWGGIATADQSDDRLTSVCVVDYSPAPTE